MSEPVCKKTLDISLCESPVQFLFLKAVQELLISHYLQRNNSHPPTMINTSGSRHAKKIKHASKMHHGPLSQPSRCRHVDGRPDMVM